MEKQAGEILAPRRLSRRGRPMWLRGVSVELRREPFGIVLIVGASNYPLFLPGVQALQALVAGNAVLIKPGGRRTRAAIACRRRSRSPDSILTGASASRRPAIGRGSRRRRSETRSCLRAPPTPAAKSSRCSPAR